MRLFYKLAKSIAHPRWLIAKSLFYLQFTPLFAPFHHLIGRKRARDDLFDDSTLLCIYDLEQLPLSFNLFEYLAAFNLHASQQKKTFYCVFLDQGISKNINTGSLAEAYSVSSREYRLRNLISIAPYLFPLCRGVIVSKDRSDVHSLLRSPCIYPPTYSPYKKGSNLIDIYSSNSFFRQSGSAFASLVVPHYPLYLARSIVASHPEKPIITITLRTSKYDSIRNSNLPAWAEFVSYLSEQGFSVVVIPDTDSPQSFSPIQSQYVFSQFSFNLELRAAIYQLSLVNMGVANGPMILSTLNSNVNGTINMKLSPKGSETEAMYMEHSLDPSQPLFWHEGNTVNSTLHDSFSNIKFLFQQSLPSLLSTYPLTSSNL